MKIGLIFPGYSSQFVGMGKEIYDESRAMQEYFEEASSCLQKNFIKLCFASSDLELGKVENAYPALFLTSTAIAAALKEQDIAIDEVAGLDLGQLGALHFAGGISLPDGLYLLAKCAQMYQEALGTWPVAAIRVRDLDYDLLAQAVANVQTEQHPLTIGVKFSKDENVVTGNKNLVDDLEVYLRDKGYEVEEYPTEPGLQSELMNAVLMHLQKYLSKVDFKSIQLPLISSVDGQPIQESKALEELFIEHLRKPIRWDLVMKRCKDWDVIIQVGPGKKLAERLAKQYPEKKVFTINKPSDITNLKEFLEKHAE